MVMASPKRKPNGARICIRQAEACLDQLGCWLDEFERRGGDDIPGIADTLEKIDAAFLELSHLTAELLSRSIKHGMGGNKQ